MDFGLDPISSTPDQAFTELLNPDRNKESKENFSSPEHGIRNFRDRNCDSAQTCSSSRFSEFSENNPIFKSLISDPSGYQVFLQFAPVYLNKVIGLSVESTGFSSALPYIITIAFKFITGPLSDRMLKSQLRSIQFFTVFPHVRFLLKLRLHRPGLWGTVRDVVPGTYETWPGAWDVVHVAWDTEPGAQDVVLVSGTLLFTSFPRI